MSAEARKGHLAMLLFSSLVANRRLLKDFVVRDLKARYVGSSMGFFWSVVFPIINLFVYMFVFRLILNSRFEDGAGQAGRLPGRLDAAAIEAAVEFDQDGQLEPGLPHGS